MGHDMTTIDRPPAEHVAEDTIAGMNDDALAEIIEDIGAEADRLGRMAGQAWHELVKRMEERGASVLDTDHWGGKLTPGTPAHEYDLDTLMQLRPLLDDEEYDKVCPLLPPPPPRPDKRYLNELAKRGGAIRQAIEDATTTTRGKPKLTLERKEGT